jgi:O-antigen ligase
MPAATQLASHRFSAAPGAGFSAPARLDGLALMRPVYWILAGFAASVALLYGGIAAATITIAALIGIWAFAEPRASLWLVTAFMVFLFVFFQQTAPLGEDLPEEFLYWGIGLAVITAGLFAAALFSSTVDWRRVKERLSRPASLAMLATLLVILASSAYGLEQGNRPFAVLRQLFGCLLLPVFYFIAIALLRTKSDVERWLGAISWAVALGSLWYVERLSLASAARGTYYREQSPLVMYSGAVAVAALCEVVAGRKPLARLAAAVQCAVCLLAALLMGSRTALGSFLAATAAILLVLVWRRWMLILALAACLIPLAAGLAPYLADHATGGRGVAGQIADRFIFSLDEDSSYLGRVAQTSVVLTMVGRHPVLGAGMGSENTFLMPDGRRLKVASVDNGWGYLLLKMGFVGLAAFLALTGLLFRQGLAALGGGVKTAPHASPDAATLALLGIFFYALVSFLSGPIFFHFSTAPFIAAVLGALVVSAEARQEAA